jgi:hypothetical protein
MEVVRMKVNLVFAAVLISFCVILSGCQDPAQDDYAKLSYEPTEVPQVMAGTVTGSANSVYTLAEGTVTCNDPAATYTLSLAKDNKLPGSTSLSGPLPENMQYFRLEIMAVMRILEDGKCLERDPSDDRVNVVVEGYYDGRSRKFTALSCSKASTLSNTDIESSSDHVVFGQIVCVYSEQMKYTFYFSNLALK